MATLLLVGSNNFQDFLNILLDDYKYEIIQTEGVDGASKFFDKFRIKLDAILVHREIDSDSVDLLVEHIRKQEPFLPIILFSFENHELLELVKKQCGYSHWIPRNTEKTAIIEMTNRVISESKVLIHK